ncbi:hypothetical protein BOTBODRAFT_31566 [Botryobasidium botryosum FD-172 SS1]|uniref:Agmatinase n=1 Tax=Botryobasidium botryosum (strain FD-172 SS1) TaxID=930990 RepID=A0A067MUX3_BOTB1|nr:hypothetical protein BOTBODRAFT_31566 [Botryobasidium botryosum FD-172 SS1]
MKLTRSAALLLSSSLNLVGGGVGASEFDQAPLTSNNAANELWTSKYGPQLDLPFTGPLSFAHIPYARCLDDTRHEFDIAILGMPFDTSVSYRPGARFGPNGIRSGSRRLRPGNGYSITWRSDPYAHDVKVIDCGDVPVTPFDNLIAVDQMHAAYATLLARNVAERAAGKPELRATRAFAKDGKEHPRIVSLGGDHTIVLPILRALHEVYGPISVIHFDSHIDTWSPLRYFSPGLTPPITHGSFFWNAVQEGIISNMSIHAGIRSKVEDYGDLERDASSGFALISTDDIDDIGTDGIIQRIRDRVGSGPVYISLDIDVVDPSMAPATGTPEPGGWTTRELNRILRGLAGLNIVGADIVEVAPMYDSNAEITSLAAANIVHEFLSMLQEGAPPSSQRPVKSAPRGGTRDEL